MQLQLQRACRKGVAGLHIALAQPGGEPALALRTGAVREAFGHHGAAVGALQCVVANAGCGAVGGPAGGTVTDRAYRLRAAKVSQAFTLPFCRPLWNQRWRCALVPWVKLSGTTAPP